MNIDIAKNIIKEEVQNLLNEGAVVNDDNFKFKQTIRYPNVQFFNYESFTNDYDAKVIDALINVDWSVGFWVNEFGIENFFIRINGIDGQYAMELRDKQSDELVQETQKNINDIKWNFRAEENVPLFTNGSLYIKGINFDFKNNDCLVLFYKPKNK